MRRNGWSTPVGVGVAAGIAATRISKVLEEIANEFRTERLQCQCDRIGISGATHWRSAGHLLVAV
jgi:hypothetical protein